jgi:hypothetical protein
VFAVRLPERAVVGLGFLLFLAANSWVTALWTFYNVNAVILSGGQADIDVARAQVTTVVKRPVLVSVRIPSEL